MNQYRICVILKMRLFLKKISYDTEKVMFTGKKIVENNMVFT